MGVFARRQRRCSRGHGSDVGSAAGGANSARAQCVTGVGAEVSPSILQLARNGDAEAQVTSADGGCHSKKRDCDRCHDQKAPLRLYGLKNTFGVLW